MGLRVDWNDRRMWIGIDPGASGAIAVLMEDTLPRCLELSGTERDVWDFIRELTVRSPSAKAGLERVSSMPEQGVSSTFKFGQSYGFLRGLLVASGIPFTTISPREWQSAFSLVSLKTAGSRTAKKNSHKARAQELFPSLKVTHAVADALLIAEYLKRFDSALDAAWTKKGAPDV